MSDAIFVSGLVLHAYHGVMQHEAKVGQTFRLDLVLTIDLTEASRTDKLKHTVSYDMVVKTASEAFCARRYRLVEAAAGAVANAVLNSCPQVRTVRVTVHKPHAPIAATFDDVGVTIERARDDRGVR
jgi:7,8-dihydroneopterin aldolase/epimerase/oxygenase